MLTVALTLIGAFLYRARGAGWGWWPFERPLNQIFVAIIIVTAGLQLSSLIPALLLGTAATIALTMGHGDYMRLTREGGHAEVDNEEMGALMRLLTSDGRLFGSRWLYEFVALSFTGLAVTLPTATVAAVVGEPAAAVGLVAAGLSKGLAYEISWRVGDWYDSREEFPPEWLPIDTEGGEWLTGAFLWGGVALSVI